MLLLEYVNCAVCNHESPNKTGHKSQQCYQSQKIAGCSKSAMLHTTVIPCYSHNLTTLCTNCISQNNTNLLKFHCTIAL